MKGGVKCAICAATFACLTKTIASPLLRWRMHWRLKGLSASLLGAGVSKSGLAGWLPITSNTSMKKIRG
jgi:hypothetical protein